MRLAPLALLLALAFSGCSSPAADLEGTGTSSNPLQPPATAREFGDARVLAVAPDPLYLEGITYAGGRVFSGTAFGATGDPVPLNNLGEPSRIYVWGRANGTLLATIRLEGEDLLRPHAVVGLTTDAQGRLYGLSSQLGLLRWTEGPGGWAVQRLATFPDLKPCALSPAPCSPTLRDEPAIGNDLTWGPDGALYVSDSFQATVWRLGPAGNVSIWFQHADLDRKFGPNGLRVSPDGTAMVLALTGPDSAEAGPLQRGSKVVAIPFPDPRNGTLQTLHTLPNGDFADGLAFGAKGDLFVLSNVGDRLFIYPAAGEAPKVVGNADLKGSAKMDFPASLAFDGAGALLVANYAWADGPANPEGRSVLDIQVDDAGAPVVAPAGIEAA